MTDEAPSPDDILTLERYVSGALPDSHIDRLLIRLARSRTLRGQLDEIRARVVSAAQLARACTMLPQGSGAGMPTATAVELTPPVYRGVLQGFRRRTMGAEEGSRVFGPNSELELELHLLDEFGDHSPAELLVADAAGVLHPTTCSPELDDDVLVFTERGDDLFTAEGDWTLCVVVGLPRAVVEGIRTLQDARHQVPAGQLLLFPVRYEA